MLLNKIFVPLRSRNCNGRCSGSLRKSSRFKIGKFAEKKTISGQPEDENNFDKQPIAPVKETIKIKKRMDVEVAPYSFSLYTISL